MKDELRQTAHELRNASRAALLAVRSMIDARMRRIEERQRDRTPRLSDDGRAGGGSAPHEIV